MLRISYTCMITSSEKTGCLGRKISLRRLNTLYTVAIGCCPMISREQAISFLFTPFNIALYY